jgi:hypothetical protein
MDGPLLEFVWLPTFERTSKKLLSDEDRRAIERGLCADLEAGELMARCGGFRKMRYPLPGRGKRGALRLVYLPDAKHERVFMALAYAKSDKATLTRREEDELRAVARAITGDRR